MVVCANANAATFPTSPNCGAATISSAADLVTALAVPALDPAQTFPVAHSFVLPHEVNFWSYAAANPNQGAFYSTGPTGNMDVDDRSLFPGASPTSAAPTNYARAFTGYLAVPQPAGTTGDFVKTLAVGVNDGAFLSIQTCKQNGASCATGTQVVTLSDFANTALTITEAG